MDTAGETRVRYPLAPLDPTELITDDSPASGIFLMTPEAAQAWLDAFNTHNRPMRKAHYEALAKDITEGRWRLTHQGIAIDNDLRLVDGQHRLMAVVVSGVAVPMMVTWNLDPAVFSVVDTNKRRTATDGILLAGLEIPNAGLAASITKFLSVLRPVPLSRVGSRRTDFTNQQVLEGIERLGADRIRYAASIGQKMHSLNGTAVGAFVYEATKAGADKTVVVEQFLTPIWRGIGLMDEADPRYSAKSYIERNSGRSVTDRVRAEIFTVLCMSWNMWGAGQSRKLFRTPTEYVELHVPPHCKARAEESTD